MDFLYDESGSPYSFIYNGTQYYYIKNLQGDVMRIVDTSGNVVANYTYDAWGKVTNSGNIVGLYNPIRYRGYYYDTDTGFYYLQSRYYDPAIKRFINADDASLIGANGDFISFNLYVYCLNNPIDRIDSNGDFSWKTMFSIGVTVATVGLALLAAIPTGGGSLVLASVGITATAATTAASTVAVTGIAITTGSLAAGMVEESAFTFATNNNHGKEKGKEFRGGSKKQRDKWYGYENNKPFKKWFERIGKKQYNGNADIDSKDVADALFETWKDLKSPFPK